MIANPREFLERLFLRAVHVASAQHCLPPYIANMKHKRIHVIGAGKAAAAMARVVEDHCDAQLSGIVVTRYGHSVECDRIEVLEAAHPVPDQQGISAARKIVDSLCSLESSDFVMCLMSGGASALMTLPHPRISLADKQAITRQLLLGGADINQINTVRKHLSAVKGGRLQQMIHPACSHTYCISDVVGDDPSTIGSGPTVPDQSTCADVLSIIKQYGISVPAHIVNLLQTNELETPKPGDRIFETTDTTIIARAETAMAAAAELARESGCEPFVISEPITGDANLAARRHARFIDRLIAERRHQTPFVVLSSGETTVTVTGSGKGGPNTQFALALAIELRARPEIYAIACDTDGIDGSETNAGATVDPTTVKRAHQKGMNPEQFLSNNDSYGFFRELGDLTETGPTLTNVNDFRAVLVTAT